MKKIILTLGIVGLCSSVSGEIITREITSTPQVTNRVVTYNSITNQITVPEGKLLKVIEFYSEKFWKNSYTSGEVRTGIRVKYGSSTNLISSYAWGTGYSTFESPIGKTYYGPSIVEVYLNDERAYSQEFSNNWIPDGGYVHYVFDLQPHGTATAIGMVPSASVVVPANATGDVDVLLEQSTDMITWTQCLPGTYNASTQKRFFRVRAVEK